MIAFFFSNISCENYMKGFSKDVYLILIDINQRHGNVWIYETWCLWKCVIGNNNKFLFPLGQFNTILNNDKKLYKR